MNEIIIDDKKYISSKQASQITGYAKDYVGQLCREGRVPARLVGRSWYVLEAAIKDHRFGANKAPGETVESSTDKEEPTQEEKVNQSFPRYEATPAEKLPSINLLQKQKDEPEEEESRINGTEKLYSTRDSVTAKTLHESWNEWFTHVDPDELELPSGEKAELTEGVEDTYTAPAEEPPASSEEEVDEEISVPLHHLQETLPQRNLMPSRGVSRGRSVVTPRNVSTRHAAPVTRANAASRGSSREGGYKALRTLLVIIGLGCAVFATLNSGYFDNYLISLSPVQNIIGISVYNK